MCRWPQFFSNRYLRYGGYSMMKTKLKKNGKLFRMFKKPYVQNRVTFTSQLYPNANTSKPALTAGASGSFNIPLLPLLAWLGAMTAVFVVVSKMRSH